MQNYFHINDALFICAVKELGFTEKIARSLGIKEASLNVYVKRVEKRIGRPLFIRVPRGKYVELNENGLEIYPICRKIVDIKSALDEKTPDNPHDFQGEIKLTSTQTILEYFYLPYITEFFRNHPKIDISINQVDDLYLEKQSINEFCFSANGEKDTDTFCYFPYHDFVQKLWASKEYIQKYGRIENISDLQRHVLIFQRASPHSPKLLGSNKTKSMLATMDGASRIINISGVRMVDRLCEMGLGIMNGSEETTKLAGLKVERVMESYEADNVTLYVKVHKRFLRKSIAKYFLRWIFECRDQSMKKIDMEPTYKAPDLNTISDKS